MITNVVVSRITLFSANMDKTAEFYKAIGINLKKSVHGWGPYYHYLAILDGSGKHVIFQIYPLKEEHVVSPQGLGFDVENISEVIGKLMEIKTLLLRPWILKKHPEMRDGCTYAAFQDPDGRTVSITQHGKAKPA